MTVSSSSSEMTQEEDTRLQTQQHWTATTQKKWKCWSAFFFFFLLLDSFIFFFSFAVSDLTILLTPIKKVNGVEVANWLWPLQQVTWARCPASKTHIQTNIYSLWELSCLLTHTWTTRCGLHMICITCISLGWDFASGVSYNKAWTYITLEISDRSAAENNTARSPVSCVVSFFSFLILIT